MRTMLNLFLLQAIMAVQVSQCDGETGSFQMKNIDFPDHLPAGQISYFSIHGFYPKKITSGKITAKVYKWIVNVKTQVDELCDKTHCPLEGEQSIYTFLDIPADSVQGTFNLVIDIIDQDNERVGCFKAPLKIVGPNEENLTKPPPVQTISRNLRSNKQMVKSGISLEYLLGLDLE